MKKIDTDVLEKMAKQKNIDKGKIEKIADNYKGKSQNELMDELVKIGKTLEGKEEVVSKFKTFLDEGQRKKLDVIMNKISEAEVQDKIDSKKSKPAKESHKSNPKSKTKSHKQEQSNNSSSTEESSNIKKKVKKVVKRVKKSDNSN
ncbi:MAG: hypothetical protein RSD22_10240 [Romboutsia sp.]